MKTPMVSSATSFQRLQTSLQSPMPRLPRSNVYSTQDPANPSASVHRKRFFTPSLTLKFLCAGYLNRGNITFATGATGELLLLDSAAFTGTITGSTGAGTGAPATSDKLDLRDINFSSAQFAKSYANNVLTVTDGTHTANIDMVGTYTLANFHFASD